MKVFFIIFVAAAAAIAAVMYVSWFFFTVACPKKQRKIKQMSTGVESAWRDDSSGGSYRPSANAGLEWSKKQPVEECWITASDGIRLHASLMRCDEPRRVIILSHGYRGGCMSEFAGISRYLHDKKSDLLFADQRCCRESGGDYITFGALEKKDMAEWAGFIDEKYEGKLPIYFYGVSLGASAVMMAADQKLPDSLRGIIADCGFSSMRGILTDLCRRWFHIPWPAPFIAAVNHYCRTRAGFDMDQADAVKALSKCRVPVLFIHGTADSFVVPSNAEDVYKACSSDKKILWVKDAPHSCSMYQDSEKYQAALNDFFERND